MDMLGEHYTFHSMTFQFYILTLIKCSELYIKISGLPHDSWCDIDRGMYIEDMPNGRDHILNYFRRHGYITAYYEDGIWPIESGTFKYWMKLEGFRNPQAIHYYRSFHVAYANMSPSGLPMHRCYDNVTAYGVSLELHSAFSNQLFLNALPPSSAMF